jgi:hypothetical protein
VQLPEVDVVDAEPVEGSVLTLTRFRLGPGIRIGRQEEATRLALEPGTDPQLGVAIAGCGVNVTPWRSRTSSVRSATSWVTRESAAAPKTVRVL